MTDIYGNKKVYGRGYGVRGKVSVYPFLCAAHDSGVVCIVLVNQYLNIKDIDISVGLNPISVGVSAVLGVPGVALMYGILFYQNFNS